MILLPGRFPIRACHARIDLKQNEKPVNQQLLLNAECTFYNIVKNIFFNRCHQFPFI